MGKTSHLPGRRISLLLPNKQYESAEPQAEGGFQPTRLYLPPRYNLFLPAVSVCPGIRLFVTIPRFSPPHH